MSKIKYCVLCHRSVWFISHGAIKEHVDYVEGFGYHELRAKVCIDCIETLKKLPVNRVEWK